MLRSLMLSVAFFAGSLVATPAQAGTLPVVMTGDACTLGGTVCGDAVITFNQGGVGTAVVSGLGFSQTISFQWRVNRQLRRIQVRMPDGTIGSFQPFTGCFSGVFQAGGLPWDFTVCR